MYATHFLILTLPSPGIFSFLSSNHFPLYNIRISSCGISVFSLAIFLNSSIFLGIFISCFCSLYTSVILGFGVLKNAMIVCIDICMYLAIVL